MWRKALLFKVISWIVLSPVMLAADKPQHSVTLTWFLSSDNSPRYQNVWRSRDCTEHWGWRAQLSPTEVEWIDYGVVAGATYCYAITVHDSELHTNSPLSNIIRVTVPND